MGDSNQFLFEYGVLRNLDSAFNLARWLTGNEQDAEDVVQEACIKAFKSIDSARVTDAKPWFLAIVRNTSYNHLRTKRRSKELELFDEPDPRSESPEDLVIRTWEQEKLRAAVDLLPVPYREVVVLRELEEMSYKQIAEVIGLPIGTVMSRLARARLRLQQCLSDQEVL